MTAWRSWVGAILLALWAAGASAPVALAAGANDKPRLVLARDTGSGFDVWPAQDREGTEAPPPRAAAPRLSAQPNPFNPKTTIRFEGSAGPLRVTLHDLRGRLLRTLYEGLASGELQLDWDGRDSAGRVLPSSVYLLRVRGEHGCFGLKLVMVR